MRTDGSELQPRCLSGDMWSLAQRMLRFGTESVSHAPYRSHHLCSERIESKEKDFIKFSEKTLHHHDGIPFCFKLVGTHCVTHYGVF